MLKYDIMHFARPMIMIEIASKELCRQPFRIPEGQKSLEAALTATKNTRKRLISDAAEMDTDIAPPIKSTLATITPK